LPPLAAVGLATPEATAAPHGCGPALLDTGMSVVCRLVTHSAHCETRNCSPLAPTWVAGVLAPAFTSQRQDGPPPDCAGAADPDPAHDHREPTLGSAADSGRTDEAWVQSFCQNGRQVYASKPSSGAVLLMAVIPDAARIDHLGVRFLLRPNDLFSDTLRLLRDPSCPPASSQCARDAASDRRVDGTADRRMLRLGLPAATFSRS
jgi:hypothetical protein